VQAEGKNWFNKSDCSLPSSASEYFNERKTIARRGLYAGFLSPEMGEKSLFQWHNKKKSEK
jgi:hypothetical protein